MLKKSVIPQLIVLIVIIFIVASIGVFFFKLSRGFTQAYTNTGLLEGSILAQNANAKMEIYQRNTTDYMVFFIYLFGVLALFIASVRTNYNPLVLMLFFVMLLFAIAMAGGIVNIYQGIAQSDAMQPEGSLLTLTNIVLSRYTPLIICIIGGVLMIIMYGKSGNGVGL